MKIALLTTESTHHTYFARRVNKIFPFVKVLAERKILQAPFETHHPFEDRRDDYEREVLFGSKDTRLKDVGDTIEVDSVNDPSSIEYLKKIEPDVIVVFGTGKIYQELIKTCEDGIINLHGGDPEEYRGLDTHLWAIYKEDFKGLVTTLHRVNERLDDGEIVSKQNVPIARGALLHQLRRSNTEVCVELVLTALDAFKKYGTFTSRPQRKRGVYYSFMPRELKGVCLERFNKYTEGLK